MFEDSLFASAPAAPRATTAHTALISIGVQAALVAMLLVIPILRPDVFADGRSPDCPAAATTADAAGATAATAPTPVRVTTLAPSEAPMAPATQEPHLQRQAFLTDAATVDTPALALGTTGIPTGAPVAIIDAWGASSPQCRRCPLRQWQRNGGPCDAARLHRRDGREAACADSAAVSADCAHLAYGGQRVWCKAIISKDGRIESAHAVSGPPLLQGAALEAVRVARYRPFLLNGQPTEVETTITINFRLGS